MCARWLRMPAIIGVFLLGAHASHDTGLALNAYGSEEAEAQIQTVQCACDRHGDPSGDGVVCDILDVVRAVDVAFRGAPPVIDPNPACPYQTTDVDCSGFTNVLDVVRIVQVAVGQATPGMVFCAPCGPAGTLIGSSECKSLPMALAFAHASLDEDCMEYDYDGVSVLLLRHVNVAFNCCPDSFTAEVLIGSGTVIIDEKEWLSIPCDCMCLYDLDYRITDLPPGEYAIRVNEAYWWEGMEPLQFTVDLTSATSGSYCVPRDQYPWGSP